MNHAFKFTQTAILNEVLLCTPTELQAQKWPKVTKSQREINLVDLFCGCGGLSLGVFQACTLAQHSLRINLAIDNNENALAVYKENFQQLIGVSEHKGIEEFVDVPSRNLKPTSKEIRQLSKYKNVDLIVAGPPCQGHSDLNNSSRRADPRNSLYMAPVRAAIALKPKVVLIENVPTVVNATENVVGTASSLLSSSGYHVSEISINLTRLGVPQTRVRHILIASLKPLDPIVRALQSLPPRQIACIDYLKDIENDAASDSSRAFNRTTRLSNDNQTRISYLFDSNVFDLPNKLRPPCHRDKDHSYISMYGRLKPEMPAQTITSGFGSMGQGRFVHPTKPRMLTAHDAARLQGFPDYFRFSNNQLTALREMIGNAVPPALAKTVVKLLIDYGHFE